jgi:hypothetical protein
VGRDIGNPNVIGALRSLLARFEAIEIVHERYRQNGAASIVIRSECQRSLAYLAGCAQNSNVGFLVWTDHERGKSLAGRVRYELRASATPASIDLSAVEQLCTCLAHTLVEQGRLDRTEAEQILATAWGDGGGQGKSADPPCPGDSD